MGLVGRILLIILLLLILLIFFVPYGIDAGYEEGVLSLRVKAGPFRITLYPKKPLTEKQKAKKRKKKEKAEAKKKAEQEKEGKEKKPKGTDETITVREKRKLDPEFLLALLKMALHAIRRFFRSFSVDFFKLHCTVAGSDPYNVAMTYGRLCAAAEELPVLCGGVVRVHRRDVAIGCDFTETRPVIDIRFVLSLQLYKIVHLAVAFLVEYLGWKWKNHREKKAATALERKDDNGRQQDQ